MQKSKTCFVRNGGVIYEIQNKGISVKKNDLVVCFYNDRYILAKVTDKPTVGEVEFTGNKSYVVQVVCDEIDNLEKEKLELTTTLLKVRKMLSDMYINKIETDDKTIDLDTAKADYLDLKKQYDEVCKKISDWKAL